MTSQMRHEADETPKVVAGLAAFMATALTDLTGPVRAARVVATAAHGLSDHATSVSKVLMEPGCRGPVALIGPSVGAVYDRPLRLDGAVHVTVSQSGVRPDVLALQASARRGGALARLGWLAALDPLATMRAPVLALSSAPAPGTLVTVGLPKTGCGWLDAVVGLLAWYRLIEAVARARGHDPDRPPHLCKVTETR